MGFGLKRGKALDECFTMRGLYSNLDGLDEDTGRIVHAHFAECRACREWRVKHQRVLDMVMGSHGETKASVEETEIDA